ncbi:MAG: hypothetical protein K8R02_07300 [Anaerohalosphaeraceae bacterium]|nr:hypothetical protein [Anaerohalosphaeraceae bacterium]
MAQSEMVEYFGRFLFPNVFKTFRIAIAPSRLLTAFIGIAVVFVAGWLMDLSKPVVSSGDITRQRLSASALSGSLVYPTELQCYIYSPEKMDAFINRYEDNEGVGLSKVLGNYCAGRFNDAVIGLVGLRFDRVFASAVAVAMALVWAVKYHMLYSAIMFFVILVCFSVVGEAICRGAALQFSRGEKPGLGQCMRFSMKKFVSLFCAPLAPVILLMCIGLFVIVIGLFVNIPYIGEIIGAILLAFVLAAGMFMAATVIWAFTGGGLMYPVMAYENSDTFDAISKSFSYVFLKPWRMAIYSLLGFAYGAVCYLFVRFFAFVLILLSRAFLEMGVWVDASKAEQVSKVEALWPKPEFFDFLGGGGMGISRNATESLAAFFVYLSILIVSGIVAAYVVSFYFSLNTVIYSLLRKSVDKTPIEEIYVEADDDEPFCEVQSEQAQSEQSP